MLFAQMLLQLPYHLKVYNSVVQMCTPPVLRHHALVATIGFIVFLSVWQMMLTANMI